MTRTGSSSASTRRNTPPSAAIAPTPAKIVLDPHREIVFPNRIREQRRRRGLQKLMALSERLPDIPYIRLSKIERGEVVARAGELQRIARALDIAPVDLLVDLTQPGFDMARWAQPFHDVPASSDGEERFAVLLAAALRARRSGDAALTIAALDNDYGLPAVILSRIENAYKTLDRWNEATLAALCRLFGVADENGLRAAVTASYTRGELDGLVGKIADPETRMRRTRERNAALWAELSPTALARPLATAAASAPPAPPAPAAGRVDLPRELPVFGAPIKGGLIAFTRTDDVVEAPRRAGPRAFALRVCRATLGAGLPASAIVVADPDRAPTAGGIAAIRIGEAYRLVTVTFDRTGATKGYSVAPDLELDLDERDPADIVPVIAAVFA